VRRRISRNTGHGGGIQGASRCARRFVAGKGNANRGTIHTGEGGRAGHGYGGYRQGGEQHPSESSLHVHLLWVGKRTRPAKPAHDGRAAQIVSVSCDVFLVSTKAAHAAKAHWIYWE